MTRLWVLAAVGAGLIAAALLFGWWLNWGGAMRFDVTLSEAAGGWRGGAGFWLALTRLGNAPARIALTVVAAGALVWRGRWREGVVIAVTTALEVGFNSGLKPLFDRARPTLFTHLDAVVTLSYPSGHSAHSMCLLLLIGLLSGRNWAIAGGVALALLIGLSRVVLGVHWPSDVLGGWAIGAGCALLGFAAARRGEFPTRTGG